MQLLQPFDCFGSQGSSVARDADFAGLCNGWKTPIEGRDQLLEVTGELRHVHRHDCAAVLAELRRDAFQISPHPPHRQYAFSSGWRAVVEIASDRHDGQRVGSATAATEDDACAGPLANSYEDIDPHNL